VRSDPSDGRIGDDGGMASDELPYTPADVEVALDHVRRSCLSLPEATEKLSHGSPTFFVRKSFVMFLDDHHGDGRLAIWCAAPEGAQALMVESEPERFFVPPYVGHRGWLGMRLDVDPDWDEVHEVIVDAYRCVAPKKLLALLDDSD
jgi:hypothetical protein